MPLVTPGLYIDNRDKAFEKEESYYLDFQVLSALVSFENIVSIEPNFSVFNNKCQYYHYYCDHLLFSMGQIANRFIVKERDSGIVLERKHANANNFLFSPETFPILSDKKARNVIEHIEEYNQKIIKKNHGVGGFNLIDTELSADIIKVLIQNRNTHPYTLNLIDSELLITWDENEITIKLGELKKELIQLKENVKSFLQIID